MKVSYRQAARDDVVHQFRYYLLTKNVPEVAIRFRKAVHDTVESLRHQPHIGPSCGLRNPRLQELRS